MSKDPAFLFYSSDFLTGTMMMDDEQVGKYIRLLCAQHQKGHLTEKHMLNICKSYDEDIFQKFSKDDNGMYFNARLDEEKTKRSNYSKSRSENRKNKDSSEEKPKDMKNICDSYVKHMENENENENIDSTPTNLDSESIKKSKPKEKPFVISQHLSMTETEYNKLVEKYGLELVEQKLAYSRNYKKLKDKVSLYLTLNNWLEKDNGKIIAIDTPKTVNGVRKL
jgi:hypothetical protein